LDLPESSSSGMEWADGSLYVGNYTGRAIHKYERSGGHVFSWPTRSFEPPNDMTYDGTSLWISDGCFFDSGRLWQYTLSGVPGNSIDVSSLCDAGNGGVAWDGRYFW